MFRSTFLKLLCLFLLAAVPAAARSLSGQAQRLKRDPFRGPVSKVRLVPSNGGAVIPLFSRVLLLARPVSTASGVSEERQKQDAKKVAKRAGQGGEQEQGGQGSGAGEAEASADSLELIREFRVEPPGEKTFGKSASGTLSDLVNLFPARNQRRINGSFYEYHRNDNLDARNFFDPVGESLPEFKRNQFGFTLGAALGRRMRVFGSLDVLRIIQGSTLVSHVPTSRMKQGDFSALDFTLMNPFTGERFAGNQIPSAMFSPVAQRLLSLFPLPNQSDPDRNFINNQPEVTNQETLSLRHDFQINDDNKVFVLYSLSRKSVVQVDQLPDFLSNRDDRDQSASISFDRTLGAGTILSLEQSFRRRFNSRLSVNAGKEGLLESIGIKGVATRDALDEGYPTLRLSGYADPGDQGSPDSGVSNTFTTRGTLTYANNNHTLTMEGMIEWAQANAQRSGDRVRGRFIFSGLYTGDAFADFLLGIPDTASRAVGSDRMDIRARSWNLSLQDRWKLSSRFDLTLGIKYNFFPPFHSVTDNISGFVPLQFEPPASGAIVIAGSEEARRNGLAGAGPRGMVLPDRNDWAPSISFAYSPFENNKLVLRSSYAVKYDPLRRFDYIRYLGRNVPFYSIETTQSPSDRPEIHLASPFEAGVANEVTVGGIEPHLRTPYVQEWRLSVQYQPIQKWQFDLAYGGSRGVHLRRIIPGNIPEPAPGDIQPRRPNPGFGRFSILTSGGAATRHALDIMVERRLSDNFSLKSGYTWSHSLDDVFERRPNNPRDLRAERGPSGMSGTQTFFINYIFDLPFGRRGEFGPQGGWIEMLFGGWRLSGITRIPNGKPYSVTLSGDPNNDGNTGDRPDLIGDPLPSDFNSTVNEWFNTAAFADPAAYSFGNAGRNILRSPGFQTWDISLIKRTTVGDGNAVEFRAEFFNAFNHTNFKKPTSSLGTDVFGQVFGAERAREIELALKFSF